MKNDFYDKTYEAFCLIGKIKEVEARQKRKEEYDKERNVVTKYKGWATTSKNIFAGCYDVWETEQDMLDSNEIIKTNLDRVRKQGYIDVVSGNDEWFVTDLGNTLYDQYLKKEN